MRAKFVDGGNGVQLADGSVVCKTDRRYIEATQDIRRFSESGPFVQLNNPETDDDGSKGTASYARRMEGAVANSLLADPKNQPAKEKSPVWGFSESNKSLPHLQALRKLKSYAENAPADDQTQKELSALFCRMNGDDLREACLNLGSI